MNLNESSLKAIGYGEFCLATILGFLFLYFSFAGLAYYFFVYKKYFPQYQLKFYRPHQIKTEIQRSLVSILMFGILSFWMKWAIDNEIYKINFEFSVAQWFLEILLLFFWNEIYFYGVHRAFHWKPLYRFHIDHHFSHVPSPFSAYSFHWSEGILLGAVMPLALFFHSFQFWSLMSLPIMSIFLNVLGHANVDFFPNKKISYWLCFSRRHSEHHRVPHSNFGFFLPWLDRLFGTSGDD